MKKIIAFCLSIMICSTLTLNSQYSIEEFISTFDAESILEDFDSKDPVSSNEPGVCFANTEIRYHIGDGIVYFQIFDSNNGNPIATNSIFQGYENHLLYLEIGIETIVPPLNVSSEIFNFPLLIGDYIDVNNDQLLHVFSYSFSNFVDINYIKYGVTLPNGSCEFDECSENNNFASSGLFSGNSEIHSLQTSCPPPIPTNPPLDQACNLATYFQGEILNSDIVVTSKEVTDYEFEEYIDLYGITNIDINFIAPGQGANYLTNLYTDGYPYIEDWTETLVGWSGYNEVAVELIVSSVDSTFTCTSTFLTLFENGPMCQLFDILNYHSSDGTSITFDYVDSNNPNYFSEQLALIGLTMQDAQTLFDANVTHIDATLSYDDASQAGLTATGSVNRSVGDLVRQFSFTINNIDTSGLIGEMEIAYNFSDGLPKYCEYSPVEFEEEEAPNDGLPSLDCNSVHTSPDGSNTISLVNLEEGDLINSGGFLFLVSEVTSSTSPFSGKAIAAIPFKNKRIETSFSGILINEDYVVTAGTIAGNSGNPADYPDFIITPDTLSFGGEICIVDPPEDDNYNPMDTLNGFDDRGFNADGIHKNGTPYDDFGFDSNGLYKGNGKYDPYGCDYQGLDSLGQPCRQNGEVDKIISTYRDSIINKFPALLDSITNSFLDSLTLKIAGLNCDGKRADMMVILNDTSLSDIDHDFIIGENGEYIDEELSINFQSEPTIPIYTDNVRNPKIVELEKIHVELFQCDKDQMEFKALLADLNAAKTSGMIEILVKREMQNLNLFQVTEFKQDETKFFQYLIEILKGIASGEIVSNSRKKDKYDYWNQEIDFYNSLASSTGIVITPESRLSEIDWMYNQGFKEIGGQNRAFYIEELHRQMQMVNPDTATGVLLPILINKNIGGRNYKIFISKINFLPGGASLDAYFIFEDPESGKRFVLEGENLGFDSGGLIGSSNLILQSNIELRLNNSAMLVLHANETSVVWDCNGFDSLNIGGHLEFCREFIIPIDQATGLASVDPDDLYKLDFDIAIGDWSNLYITLNDNGQTNPFVLTQHQDMTWDVSNIAIDMSDTRSPTSFLPYQYATNMTTPSQNGTSFLPKWKGVFIGNVSVELPSKFSSDPNNKVSIAATNVAIDRFGFTGYAETDLNLMSLSDGNAGGWPLSLEGFNVLVKKNRIAGGGFNGQIKVPILEDPMDYVATYEEGNIYKFVVNPLQGNTRVDMLLADANLRDDCSIEMQYADGDFTIIATLNGELKVGISDPIEFSVPPMKFTGLKVGNKAPYFETGTWEIGNSLNLDLSGFKLTMDEIKPLQREEDGETLAGLGFNIELTLAMNKVKAKGGFEVLGNLTYDAHNRQKWSFKKVVMNRFDVYAELGAGTISGYIYHFNDNVYGEGFEGMIDAQFKGMPKITAKAMFGAVKQEDYRYFFVDAMISGIKGIKLGFLEVNGFMGGLSYHMTQTGYPGATNPCTATPPPSEPLGTSLSGTIYAPSKAAGFGFKVGACVATSSSEEIFNGLISFEILFNAGGGLNQVSLNGMGNFMSAVADNVVPNGPLVTEGTDTKPESTQPLSAHIRITYNFVEKSLHGEIVAFMNIKDKMVGAGDNDQLVKAVVHADKNKWYIYIGTPTSPCGIHMKLPGGIIFKLEAYLDIGTDVPNIPDIDERIRAIASTAAKNPQFRNSGAGFAFGAKIITSFDLDVKIAQAEFDAILGFDIMVKNFGDAKCVGQDGSLGVNGWYAVGQLYAMLDGSLKIFGINVLKAGIAAVLQAQLPNPFFAQATVGVYIKCFLFKGRKSFSVKLGKQCNVQTDDPIGMELINSISPANHTDNIPLESEILVYFNAAMGKSITLSTLNGETDYESRVKSLTVKDQYGNIVPCSQTWDDDNIVLTLTPNRMFNINDSITVFVEAAVDNGSTEESQSMTIGFRTTGQFNYIPESNVKYSYPIENMENYYKNEYIENEGYIKLVQGMPEIFYGDDQYYKIQIKIDNGIEVKYVDYTYFPISSFLTYKIDPSFIRNGEEHTISIIKKAVADNSSELSASRTGELDLFSFKFRASNHNTFIEKCNARFKSSYTFGQNPTKLNMPFNAGEAFDIYELEKEVYPKIEINTNVKSEPWYNEYTEEINSINWPRKINGTTLILGNNVSGQIEDHVYLRANDLEIKSASYLSSVAGKVKFDIDEFLITDPYGISELDFLKLVPGAVRTFYKYTDISIFTHSLNKYWIKLDYEIPGGIKTSGYYKCIKGNCN